MVAPFLDEIIYQYTSLTYQYLPINPYPSMDTSNNGSDPHTKALESPKLDPVSPSLAPEVFAVSSQTPDVSVQGSPLPDWVQIQGQKILQRKKSEPRPSTSSTSTSSDVISPSESSKEFTFRLQIASDEDVKIKSPTGLHLQEYDKWQLEKLMQDAIKRANYTDSSEVELPGISEEKQIQDFMIKHVTPDLQMKVDISVKDLRRIIPLLIMHLFNIREERTQKKVKGLWTERPRGWPDTVPYYDPNNQTKDGPGKPKKETLKKMFDFLLLKYREYVGGQWPAELLSPTPNGQAHTPAPSQLSPQSYPEASSSVVMAAGTMATGQVSPSLVVKMEEHHNDEEWMHELMERLRRKVAELEKDMYLNEKTVGLLCIIRDLLSKMYEVRAGDDEISLFFITSGHEFEATLDIIHLKQEMPKDHQRKWEEFQAKWYLKIVSLANQAMQGGSDISEAEALTRQ